MKLREITYLVTARTTMADCVPIFWTPHRDQAVGKASGVRSGVANDAAHRMKLPPGEVIGVHVVELVNGAPSRMEEMTLRDSERRLADQAARSIREACDRKAAATVGDELPE